MTTLNPSRNTRLRPLPALLGLLFAGAGAAAGAEQLFELGTVQVTATRAQVGEVGTDQVSSLITRQDMLRYDRDNVGDAVNLLAGVSLSTNSRNEKTVSLRGLDARQAPLFIDGIPVYVPYDGYVDFNRFSTADLSAIQVAKGFSSVVYGPNTLGGAINLISRKPAAPFEGDASVGFGAGNERQASVNAGTNRGLWYLQAGASYVNSDYFRLSSDFKPTSTENGGRRDNAYREDRKLSLKIGLTPNAGDEYALSYYKQDGEKGQPPSTDPAAARYWQWPFWDKESVYFVSKTRLGASETVKLRAYQDKFDNSIRSYTNGNYNVLKTSGSGSVGTGISIYHDQTDGAALELESTRFGSHALRLVAQYKKDHHREVDAVDTLGAEFKDALRSYAIEDNIGFGPRLLLSLGLSHHELRPDTVYSAGNAYSLPSKKSADDAQAALYYDHSASARLYASVAQKTRLPTLKDRYSARLGTYVENPALKPEQSTNYEIGYQGAPWPGAKLEAALFYSEIEDKIQSVYVARTGSSCAAATKCQMQNVGKVHAGGVELGLDSPLTAWLEVGGNYTYIDLKNVSNPATRLIDVPRQKLTLHALVKPLARLDLVAFAESNSARWASNTVQLGGFTTFTIKAVYRPVHNLSVDAGVGNLGDKNYALADGFPSAGRTVSAHARYQF